jgi:cellulose synthase (UDP-forming)
MRNDLSIINTGRVPKILLISNILIALAYFSWWLSPINIGHPILYFLLFFGEFYHVLMALLFWHTIWPFPKRNHVVDSRFNPSVDIYITVAGEPVDVISKTGIAAKNLDYSNKKVYFLNDGYVAKKENWRDVELLAKGIGIKCITRKEPGGAKAGNINHALRNTEGEIVVVFDADMVPDEDFLKKTITYFSNSKVGFVQTPQYYQNFQNNEITGGSWEQQEFFFGPIMRGKDNSNAAFICGTNVAIRRTALEQVGGMNEKNIAEDFLTSLAIHQKGWQSIYVPEVLAQGLAPEDLLSYYKQQLRWARGSLEVLFGYNPLFKKGLSLSQKIEYLSSALFYFNGFIVAIDIIMPLIFLYTSIEPVSASTASLAMFFIPFMFFNLLTLYLVSNGRFTFRAISFTQSSFFLQLQALLSIIFHRKMGFSVTSKKQLQGNFINLAYPHILYILIGIIGTGLAINREGMNPAVMTNVAWYIFNVILFIPFIYASLNLSEVVKEEKKHAVSYR